MANSRPRVIVGLDFGTTFSGFAFAHTSDPEKVYTSYDYPKGGGAEKPYCKTLSGSYYKDVGGVWQFKSWGFPARAEYTKDIMAMRKQRGNGPSNDPRLQPAVGTYYTKFKLQLASKEMVVPDSTVRRLPLSMAQSSHDAMGSPTIAISPPVHGSVLHTTDADYDVFLNHRGPDVKDGFISHLDEALRTAGLNPFLDKAPCRKEHPAFSSIDDALEVATVFSLTFRSSLQLEDELLFNWEYPRYRPIFIEVVWDRDEDLENEDLTPEQETWRQMEWPKVPLDSSTALSNSEVPLDSILQELASGITGLPHPVRKRSLRKGETWMPDEVVDNNEKLMSTLAPFFKKNIENALEPILGPVASILRSQGEEEWKHQETLFALEERQLALRTEKIQLKRRRLGLSQRKRRSSSTKPLRPRIQLEHRLKFPRVH